MDERKKEKLLNDNDYKFSYVRGVYYNTKLGKIFSVEYVDYHSVYWLKVKIKRKETSRWNFYFLKDILSLEIKNDIIDDLCY